MTAFQLSLPLINNEATLYFCYYFRQCLVWPKHKKQCKSQGLLKQVSFKKEVGVMVNDSVFWLTVCLILKMCY